MQNAIYDYYKNTEQAVWDWLDEIKEDVSKAIDEGADARDIIEEYIINEDSVTGNGSGSYTFDTYLAYEYIWGNEDILNEIIEVCGEFKDPYNWEALDVTIRCYMVESYGEDWVNEWCEDNLNEEEES